jgi:threonine/homoserine/homoserine lactone efflux protein
MTILSFAAIFAGLGVGSAGGNYVFAGLLVLGVFLGSATWWLILSGTVGAFRTKFDLSGLRWVNRISGIIITGFGVLAFLSLVR